MSSPSVTTPKRSKTPKSPITTEAEREQALRDYKLTIEYKHLKQHSPSGVYLLPSLTSLRTFHGVIFLRRGLYANGIFKFTMELPQGYNDVDTWPQITFQGWVYSPHVNERGELDLKSAYPQWDPHRHYLVTVLTYLKKIFYMKSFGDDAVANIDARELSRSDPKEYRRMVSKCVKESQRGLYMNEPGSSLVFREENECHVALRMLMKEKFEDPNVAVSRTLVLECVEEAQRRVGMDQRNESGESNE